jgi:hypothetical protein
LDYASGWRRKAGLSLNNSDTQSLNARKSFVSAGTAYASGEHRLAALIRM